MENKEGLCEAQVRKNLVLAEIGEPLTLPLATLNRSCEFKKEWDRIQEIWHKKKAICICGTEFETSNRKRKYCSEECALNQKNKTASEYNKRPEVKARLKAKRKVYNQRPEVKARKKRYYEEYAKRPEVKARKKKYYEARKQ